MFLKLFSIAVICVGCFALVHLLMWHMKRWNLYKLASRLNGPAVLPVIGNGHSLIGDSAYVLSKLTEWSELYPSLFRIWVGPLLAVMVTDADQIKVENSAENEHAGKILSMGSEFQEILNNPTVVERGDEFRHFGEALLGTGLVSAHVSQWRVHRKLIQGTFNKRILDSFVEIFSAQAKILTEQMERNLDGPDFELFRLLSSCSLDMICESAMGISIGVQTDRNCHYAEAFGQATASISARMFTFWLHTDLIFNRTKLGKIQQKKVKYLRDVADNIVEMRKKELFKRANGQPATGDNAEGNPTSRNQATLDYLLTLPSDAKKLSDQELRDEVTNLILGATDTSAVTMTTAMLMLASHPDIQDKVYEELHKIYGDADGDDHPVKPNDLMYMKYLECVIKETLRLFPVFPFIFREMTEDLNIGERTLPKGCYLTFGIRSVQRNEKYWPNPLEFDPDRFSPEASSTRNPYAYLPFGAGPRNCVGSNYGMMAMKTVMATVLRRYILKKDHTVPPQDIEMSMEIVMRPVKPMTLRIERRSRN